ncbi:hypothetical protein FB451DRAFT_1245384 [Mycena latifolia]|nr:hypothetical protein FB451DRAFT_1245384 [Mycena latifolia]
MLSFPGAFTIASYDRNDPLASRPIFIIPIDDDAESNPRTTSNTQGVQPIPPTCASRLTVGMVAAIAAFHLGILGVPRIQAVASNLPTYNVHWELNNTLRGAVSPLEIDQSIDSFSGRAVFIIPCGAELGPVVAAASLRGFITKALTRKVGYVGDGNRPREFRGMILGQDRGRCCISEDTIVEASHIIHRYIGSPILFSVLDSARQTYIASQNAPQNTLDLVADLPFIFADIRHPPQDYPFDFRIDQVDNGEAVAPSLHVAKDVYIAYGTFNGLGLWFDTKTANCRHAVTDFGCLANDQTPEEGRLSKSLYSNAQGVRLIDTDRSFLRSLDLYLVFCTRFMPVLLKKQLISAVAQATRHAEAVVSGGGAPYSTQNLQASGPITGQEDVRGGAGADRSRHVAVDDPQLQSACMNNERVKRIGVKCRNAPQPRVLCRCVAGHRDRGSPSSGPPGRNFGGRDERADRRSLSPAPLQDLPLEELEKYHKTLVFKAICLLHVGTRIETNIKSPSKLSTHLTGVVAGAEQWSLGAA